jgi:hypothetical protein
MHSPVVLPDGRRSDRFLKGFTVKSRIVPLVLLTLVCVAAFASGAPWYKWKNRYDGTILCAQTSPGETWYVIQGPFMESQCRKPGNPQ